MESVAELNVDLFSEAGLSWDQIKQLTRKVHSNAMELDRFTQQVEAHLYKTSPEDRLKAGIGLYIIGRMARACEMMQEAQECQEKYLCLAFAQRAIGHYTEALGHLDKSLSLKADALAVSLEKVATLRMARDFEAAEKELTQCANYENVSAEYHYQLARLQEVQGQYDESVDNAQRALSLVPDHVESLFMLALRADLEGDDIAAMGYYRQIMSSDKSSVNALLNLAVLYEDQGEYDKASQCIETVLCAFPNHTRARLFRRDVDSSKTMYFDEERERKLSRKNQILETPISDFELSVRSRNCLKKMNITTLGDLLNITEAELLSYKNFGETSLREIKVILESKGLTLGMALEDKHFAKQQIPEPIQEEQDQGLLSKPVEDLQLSVRARKCLQKLNIRTIGDLTRTTDAELLGCKNFGVTSLNEINKRLGGIGLSLRRLD